MSVDSTRERSATVRDALVVPWLTVLPLAIVMAYADGFWMLTLRGAVGAIERTQEPFISWLRESTLVLPLFVFAVLGALTLALRLFGPVLSTPRTITATALLVVAAGSVVGIAEIVGSSAYDYYLESGLLSMMGSMRGTCGAGCLALQQQSTLTAIVRAVLYTGGFIVVTNLVLVGWVVAMRGGRLAIASMRNVSIGDVSAGDAAVEGDSTGRLLLVATLLGSAVIHAAVVPDHLALWPAAGAFFVALTAAEILVAILLLARPRRAVLVAAAAVSIGPLLLWLWSRSVGLPFGPVAGLAEPVRIPDIICCALEIVTSLVVVGLLRSGVARHARTPAASAHVRWLTLLAIIAATAIGLAGTTPAWFEGSESLSETTMSH